MNISALKQSFFVTGTDTGVGKTYVSVQLIQSLVSQGYRVIGMKPIASGCEMINGIWQNEDVAKLIAASNVQAPREWINPYCFDPPIAPHIAAEQAGMTISIDKIQYAFAQLQQLADIVVVEGAGGLLVPINQHDTIATLIAALNLPAVMVVSIKLGCINHALLTAQVLNMNKINLLGWVSNEIEPYKHCLQNIAAITQRLGLQPLNLALSYS